MSTSSERRSPMVARSCGGRPAISSASRSRVRPRPAGRRPGRTSARSGPARRRRAGRRRSAGARRRRRRPRAAAAAPLPLLPLHPAGQRPGERDLHQLQHQQPAQRGRGELAPLRLTGVGTASYRKYASNSSGSPRRARGPRRTPRAACRTGRSNWFSGSVRSLISESVSPSRSACSSSSPSGNVLPISRLSSE